MNARAFCHSPATCLIHTFRQRCAVERIGFFLGSTCWQRIWRIPRMNERNVPGCDPQSKGGLKTKRVRCFCLKGANNRGLEENHVNPVSASLCHVFPWSFLVLSLAGEINIISKGHVWGTQNMHAFCCCCFIFSPP